MTETAATFTANGFDSTIASSKPRNAEALLAAYMEVYDGFAVSTGDVADALDLSQSTARARLTKLEGFGLVCGDLQESHEGWGPTETGGRARLVGQNILWQPWVSHDHEDRDDAERRAKAVLRIEDAPEVEAEPVAEVAPSAPATTYIITQYAFTPGTQTTKQLGTQTRANLQKALADAHYASTVGAQIHHTFLVTASDPAPVKGGRRIKRLVASFKNGVETLTETAKPSAPAETTTNTEQEHTMSSTTTETANAAEYTAHVWDANSGKVTKRKAYKTLPGAVAFATKTSAEKGIREVVVTGPDGYRAEYAKGDLRKLEADELKPEADEPTAAPEAPADEPTPAPAPAPAAAKPAASAKPAKPAAKKVAPTPSPDAPTTVADTLALDDKQLAKMVRPALVSVAAVAEAISKLDRYETHYATFLVGGRSSHPNNARYYELTHEQMEQKRNKVRRAIATAAECKTVKANGLPRTAAAKVAA